MATLQAEPRSLARGAVLASAARACAILASALVTIIVAHLLGPEGSGSFAVITTLTFTLAAVGSAGVDLGLAWMLGGRRWEIASALRTSALAAVALGLLAGVIGLLSLALARESAFERIDAGAVWLGLAALAPMLLVGFFAQAALATQHYESALRIALVQAVGYVAAVLILTAAFGLVGAAAGLMVGQLAGASTAVLWGWRATSGAASGARSLDPRRLREAAGFGVKLYVANVASILVYRFDLFLLNAYGGSAEAGYYAVAIASTSLIGLLPAALGSVLFPRLASLPGEREEEATRREIEGRAIRHTVLLVILGGALLAAGAPLLVEPLFGAEFGPAVAPLLLLIPGAAALGLATTLYVALAGRGAPERAMRIALLITPLAIGLYFLLIPSLGAEGAALGSDVAYITSAILAGVALRRVSGPGPRRRLLPGREELRAYPATLSEVLKSDQDLGI